MNAITPPIQVTQDVNSIKARLDHEYAICLRQTRVDFSSNAYDFSFLCENLRGVNSNGKPSDDENTWQKVVDAVREAVSEFRESSQRQVKVDAKQNYQIAFNMRLTAEELAALIAEIIQPASKKIAEISESGEFRAVDAVVRGALDLFNVELQKVLALVADGTKKLLLASGDGLQRARKFVAGVVADLDAILLEARQLAGSASQVGESIKRKIKTLKLPPFLRSHSADGTRLAKFYAEEIGQIIGAEINKLVVSESATKLAEKFGRAFKWLSIGLAINSVLQADNKVREILAQITSFAVGVGLTALAATLAAACGPLYPLCFVLFAAIFNYYGTEFAASVARDVYDFLDS